MSSENVVQRAGWKRVARTSVMFRLQTGKAWVSAIGPDGIKWSADRNSLTITAPRPMALGFGLASNEPVVGAGDLVGRTTMYITAAMVGKRVAIFTSLEAKRSDGGVRSTAQKNWDKQTRAAGGISGFFSSPEEAEEIIATYLKKIEE